MDTVYRSPIEAPVAQEESPVLLLRRLVRENARLRLENARMAAEVEELHRYRELAEVDPLTRLGNRRHLEHRLAQERARAERVSGEGTFSLLVIDLNDFKRINDRFGHAAGDRALCTVAVELQELLRATDVCCRIGGDEFAAILPGAAGAGVEEVANRLTRHFCERSNDYRPAISVGFATYGVDAIDMDALLACADERMYAHKRSMQPVRLRLASEA
jgi:diguanylate cyclase (GGDEF)-like protein